MRPEMNSRSSLAWRRVLGRGGTGHTLEKSWTQRAADWPEVSAGSEGKRVEKEECVMVPSSPAAWMEVQEEEWQGREEGRWGLKLAWLNLNSRGR